MAQRWDRVAIRLHPDDNIAIAKHDIASGTSLELPDGEIQSIGHDIQAGHKIALAPIPAGSQVRRYGYPIGIATLPISPGEWVHVHNLAVGEIRREYSYQIIESQPARLSGRTFMGFRRPNGEVGTRNYVAVISTVNCSADVATQIARSFTPDTLAPFPNVDGVVPVIHSGGCSFPLGGLTHTFLRRCLANVAINPNVGAYIYVGLGCEANPASDYCSRRMTGGVFTFNALSAPHGAMVIQDQGGFRKTVEAGIEAVKCLLPQVNACIRTEQPVSALKIALQCGGSDSWSGVTANPLLGNVVDQIVAEGGTAILAETPEIFGAEHLLTQRVISAEVGQRLIDRFQWWNEQSVKLGFSVDNNPTPGNKRGGLTTIYEKSLGAVAKGGSTPLMQVLEYGERATRPGLVFMDTPGNDPISVTGQLASGCNLIAFTTGRGSVYGSNLAPCIKIASNSELSGRMPDDMDFDAGVLLNGKPMQSASNELLDLVVATASGKRTYSEHNGLSENEFVPWHVGTAL